MRVLLMTLASCHALVLPAPDTDNDAIADLFDLCPHAAETLNGVLDADGCPEGDADGDGVVDEIDPCPAQHKWVAESTGCPPSVVSSSIGYELQLIDAGELSLGSDEDSAEHRFDERRAHVELSRPLYVGRTEITWAHYESLMASQPKAVATDPRCRTHLGQNLVAPELPVVCLTWQEAIDLANAMSARDGLAPAYHSHHSARYEPHAEGYRLPTEAEWEYFAAAGERTDWPSANSASEVCTRSNVRDAGSGLPRASNTCEDGHAGPAPVGSLVPHRNEDDHLTDLI